MFVNFSLLIIIMCPCNLSRPCKLQAPCDQNRGKKRCNLSLKMNVFPRGINFCLSINQRVLCSIRLSRNFIQVFHLKKKLSLVTSCTTSCTRESGTCHNIRFSLSATWRNINNTIRSNSNNNNNNNNNNN